MKNLGQHIRELRKERNFTIQELANLIGVNKSAISFWENNTNEPKASYIIKLAEVLNVTTDYLLGVSTENNYFHEEFEYSDGTHKIKHKK